MSNPATLRSAAVCAALLLPCACGSGGGSASLDATVPIGIEKASTVAFSADGNTVAVTGYDKSIVFVDVPSASVRTRIEEAHARRVLYSGFVSDLSTASWDGIKVWQPDSGTPIHALDAGGELIETEFYGVVATSEGTRTGTFTGERFEGSIESMSVTPDGLYAVVVDKDSGEHGLTVWDLESGATMGSVFGAQGAVLSPDGTVVAVCEREQGERIDMGTSVKFEKLHTTTLYGVPYLSHRGQLSGVWAHAFSADGETLLVETDDEQVALVAVDGRRIATLAFEGRVRFSRFSPDGRFVLVSSGSKISCHDARTGAVRWQSTMDADEAGQVVQITRNSELAIFCSSGPGSPVQIVDLETGAVRQKLKGDSIPGGFALSLDGRMLAVPMYKAGLALWRL